jgi:spore photoproduct lyase
MIHESQSSLSVPHIGGVNLTLEAVNHEAEIVSQNPNSEIAAPKSAPLWMPQRAVFTPAALEHGHGRDILARCEKLGIPIELPKANRVTGLKKEDVRATYSTAKRTLAVVVSPPSYLKLQPIPPSADWQYHLAEGCPAHCQYCYLAGSLSGPPVVRVFANLEEILGNLPRYEEIKSPVARPRGFSPTSERGREDSTSFEVSCYTDPLGIEHLSGSLAASIRYFGTREKGFLRTVSKFDAVDSLLDLPHNGQSRFRFSINAVPVSSRLEGGTANVAARLQAARKMALPREKGGGDYPIGLVIAPIMPMEDWREHYSLLLDEAARALDFPCNLTFELITHRFTPGSKDVLLQWYPKTSLDLDESTREIKRNKFGGTKYVYPRETMKELKTWFTSEIEARFPNGKILYWT